MYIPISHLWKIFAEWLSLLLQIGTDLLQSGTAFIIANQGKGYCELGQIYNKAKWRRSVTSWGSYYESAQNDLLFPCYERKNLRNQTMVLEAVSFPWLFRENWHLPEDFLKTLKKNNLTLDIWIPVSEVF